MNDDDIESPCISVCIIDQENGLCRGCLRTLGEISRWMRYTPDEKRSLLQVINERRAAAAQPKNN
jgi:uncharacterized protein